MTPSAPTDCPRRFTIFDFVLLTVVLAVAFSSARSNLPKTTEILGQIDYAQLTTMAYVQERLLGKPRFSQLDSVQLLMGSSIFNALISGVEFRRFEMPYEGQALAALRQCVVLAFPVLVYLNFALLLLRLIKPRPDWGNLVRQPGCLACLATVGSLLVVSWIELAAGIRISLIWVAATVGITWLVLAATGRWTPERSWIDRTGRILGYCWLMVGLIAVG